MEAIKDNCRMERILKWMSLHPWVLAAVFLALMMCSVICVGLLFANMCEGRFRIMPELPDTFVVALDRLAAWSFAIAVPMGIVILILPIVPLLFRRAIYAYGMFVYNLGAIFVGVFLFAAICFMGLTAGDQVEVAQKNLMCEDSRMKKRLPKFRRNCWEFCNGRFIIWRQDEKDDVYWLVDEKWRRATDGRLWEDRVLLDDIAKWREVAGVLYVLTKTGGRHVLDYKNGKAHEYPNAQHCPQSSQSDEVFENLERRLRNGGCK